MKSLKTYSRAAFEATPIGVAMASCSDIYNAVSNPRAGDWNVQWPHYDMSNASPWQQHVVFPPGEELVSYYAVSGAVRLYLREQPHAALSLRMGQGVYEPFPHRGLIHERGTDYDRIDVEVEMYRDDPQHIHVVGVNRFRSAKSVPQESGPAMDAVMDEMNALVRKLNDGYAVDFARMKAEVWNKFDGEYGGLLALFNRQGRGTDNVRGSWMLRETADAPYGPGFFRPYTKLFDRKIAP